MCHSIISKRTTTNNLEIFWIELETDSFWSKFYQNVNNIMICTKQSNLLTNSQKTEN